MLYWDKFKEENHKPDIRGKRKFYDANIYTFDIETSSYYVLDGKVYPAVTYDNLSDKEKQRCIKSILTTHNINTSFFKGKVNIF